jgi:anti-sigma-K factor RskA
MNCEQAEELLGAYAVDALSDDEAQQLRTHIATCADHAARAAEMRALASQLAETVEPVAPPAQLRTRVLTAIAREPQLALPGGQPSPVSTADHTLVSRRGPSAREGGAGPSRWPFRRVRPSYAWGALAAAIIAGLLAWNIVLQTGGESDAERYAIANADIVAPMLAGDRPIGSILYFEDERRIAVVADDVPQLDATQTYQMWAIADGAPSSIGLLSPDDGRGRVIVPFDATRADTFAMTIEPAGGSAQPTSEPVFVATIAR